MLSANWTNIRIVRPGAQWGWTRCLFAIAMLGLASCQYREKDPETGEWINVSEQEYQDVTTHDDNEIQELNR